jgi:hypothetical protein
LIVASAFIFFSGLAADALPVFFVSLEAVDSFFGEPDVAEAFSFFSAADEVAVGFSSAVEGGFVDSGVASTVAEAFSSVEPDGDGDSSCANAEAVRLSARSARNAVSSFI